MKDLPKLEKLHLNSLALEGDKADERKKIPTSPFHYANTLRIASNSESWLSARSSFSAGVPVRQQMSAVLWLRFLGEWAR